MINIIILLGGCITQDTAEKSVLSATNNNDAIQIVYPPIPTPEGVTPVSRQPRPTPASETTLPDPFTTPAPDEKVQLGTVIQLIKPTSTDTSPHYAIREEMPTMISSGNDGTAQQVNQLFVQDVELGTEMRLGDDAGNATLALHIEQYVIWSYRRRFELSESSGLQTGLYALELTTGKQLTISQADAYQWYPEINGNWLVYVEDTTAAHQQHFANLYAHNLQSGENVCVSRHVPLAQSHPPTPAYYALDAERVTWLTVDTVKQQPIIQVYEFTTQISRTLQTPILFNPRNLSISGDYIVWWASFWQGYDLQQNAHFTIPVIPDGWENVPIEFYRPVTVKDEHIYWGLSVNKTLYHFRAPLIRK